MKRLKEMRQLRLANEQIVELEAELARVRSGVSMPSIESLEIVPLKADFQT